MVDLWISSAQASVDMGMTLSHRVPMLLTGAATERGKRRMAIEKLAAGVDAALAAGCKARSIGLRKPTADPLIALGRAAEVVQAAAQPIQACVAGNAKRLRRSSARADRRRGGRL